MKAGFSCRFLTAILLDSLYHSASICCCTAAHRYALGWAEPPVHVEFNNATLPSGGLHAPGRTRHRTASTTSPTRTRKNRDRATLALPFAGSAPRKVLLPASKLRSIRRADTTRPAGSQASGADRWRRVAATPAAATGHEEHGQHRQQQQNVRNISRP